MTYSGDAPKPVFRVWCPSDGGTEEEARDVPGYSHEDAAEAWAELHDQEYIGEWSIVAGAKMMVHVKDAAGVEKRFDVTGEAVPQYTAYEVE